MFPDCVTNMWNTSSFLNKRGSFEPPKSRSHEKKGGGGYEANLLEKGVPVQYHNEYWSGLWGGTYNTLTRLDYCKRK